MRGAWKTSLAVTLCMAVNLLATDGIAVSVAKTRGIALGSFQSDDPVHGTIVKCTIQNDRVTRCDTIYDEYIAGFPVLNVEGTKCAFVRKDVPKGTTGDAAWTMDNHNYITVMNIDGSNVHDLDTFPAHETDWNIRRIALDWTAHDLYYTNEVCWWYEPDQPDRHCTEVWKVTDNDPSSQTLVVTYGGVGTFGLSLDATRAGISSFSCKYGDRQFCCIPHVFPPASEPQRGSWSESVHYGCGSYLSPSGKYHVHFWDGGHNVFRINTWNPPYEELGSVDVDAWNDFAPWSGMPRDSIGGTMHYPRYSVNSDKWICGMPLNAIDARNQFLVNWVDQKAILVSRNSATVDGFIPKNDPGDFWVAGGPGGITYEDVNGNWVDLGGTVVGTRHDDLYRTPLKQSPGISVYTVQGRLVGSWKSVAISGGQATKFSRGAYILKDARDERVGTVLLQDVK